VGRPEEDEVEFSEQAPNDSDEETLEGDATEESQLDYAAEAPEEQDVYETDWSSAEDSGGFAEDAGTEASYGFESASDTSRFSREVDEQVASELADDLGDTGDDVYAPAPELQEADESLEAALSEVTQATSQDEGLYPPDGQETEGEATGFGEIADEAAEYAAEDEATGFAEDEATGFAEDESTGFAEDEATGFADVEDHGAAGFAAVEDEAAGFAAVEPAAEDEGADYAAEEAPEAAVPAPEGRAASDAGRSGQVSKDALDAIFARAAEIKRKT